MPMPFPKKPQPSMPAIKVAPDRQTDRCTIQANAKSFEIPSKETSAANSVLSLKDDEKDLIAFTYQATGKDAAKTAQILNMSSTTLYRRLKQYGLK